ncbi:MAG: 2-amino-4-hydroxy-6-hydroxymethyldihydropteridine diphosphokinase [Gammaproteobacteria bacterium]
MQAVEAYIGLGSNLSDPQTQVTSALEEINSIPDTHVLKVSSLYVSQPMGPSDQPEYVNAVAKISTSLSPEQLLDKLQGLEQVHRRKREGKRWGPRTLDLDIILFGDLQMETKSLQIPHYGVAEREFVLIPLQELQANLIIPGKGAIEVLISQLPAYELKKLNNNNE